MLDPRPVSIRTAGARAGPSPRKSAASMPATGAKASPRAAARSSERDGSPVRVRAVARTSAASSRTSCPCRARRASMYPASTSSPAGVSPGPRPTSPRAIRAGGSEPTRSARGSFHIRGRTASQAAAIRSVSAGGGGAGVRQARAEVVSSSTNCPGERIGTRATTAVSGPRGPRGPVRWTTRLPERSHAHPAPEAITRPPVALAASTPTSCAVSLSGPGRRRAPPARRGTARGGPWRFPLRSDRRRRGEGFRC